MPTPNKTQGHYLTSGEIVLSTSSSFISCGFWELVPLKGHNRLKWVILSFWQKAFRYWQFHMVQTLDDKNLFGTCALAAPRISFHTLLKSSPVWFVVRYLCSVSQRRKKDKGGGVVFTLIFFPEHLFFYFNVETGTTRKKLWLYFEDYFLIPDPYALMQSPPIFNTISILSYWIFYDICFIVF